MKLAFYYHIPIAEVDNELFLPGYLGVFIDELAKNVDNLILVMHQANEKEEQEAEYRLISNNVQLVNLGLKTSNVHRSVFHKKILKNKLRDIQNCDAFLVRSPSPLAPYLSKYFEKTKILYLVVGDYREGAKQIGFRGIKNFLLYIYFMHNDWIFRKKLHEKTVFVNSPELLNNYQTICKEIHLVKTSTLRSEDFYFRDDFQLKKIIELLYTGRIEKLKGLIDLIDAGKLLIQNGCQIRIHIVGWENNPEKPFEKELLKYAQDLGIKKYLIFHGKKKIGSELNHMYRMADIYIMPSHHEGFPRTIWEAMANSLPVVTTKVGSIPQYLEDNINAILVEPKDSKSLYTSIFKLIKKPSLRSKIAENGFSLAKQNSLDVQTKILTNKIQNITCKTY